MAKQDNETTATTPKAKDGGPDLRVVPWDLDSPFALPHAPDAERAVLAMCLEAPDRGLVLVMDIVGSQGAPDIFHIPAHRLVWRTLWAMYEAGPGDGAGISLLSLTEKLRSLGKLDEVGGSGKLSDLVGTDGGYNATMLRHYLGILIEAWQRRLSWQAGGELRKIAAGSDEEGRGKVADPAELVNGVMAIWRRLGLVRDRLLRGARSAAEGSAAVSPADRPALVGEILAARRAEPLAPVYLSAAETADEIEAAGLMATLKDPRVLSLEQADGWLADPGAGLVEALRGGWCVVVVKGSDGTGSGERFAPEVQALLRALREIADRVTVLDLAAAWGSGTAESLAGVLEAMLAAQGTKADRAEAWRVIRGEAELGVLPGSFWYEGYWHTGPKGGVVIQDDLVARRVMARERLLWAGGEFWQWGLPDAAADGGAAAGMVPGTWNRWRDGELRAARVVREVLRQDERPREAITRAQVSSIVGLMQSSRFCTADDLNGHDPMWINCRSGMLHAKTGEIRPHGEDDYSTTQVPLSWDPAAQCDPWLQWLDDRLGGDAEVIGQLQEIFGYCLVPACNYHKFFFFYGDGGTGKSTAVNVLGWLVGESNVTSLRLEELDQGFVRGQLVGKSLYLCPEVTPRSFRHMDMIKAITSGDPIGVDVKYRQPFTFSPRGRLVMTSNVVACTSDVTEGFARRMLQMNWDRVIPDSEKRFGFEDEVLRPVLPGIFRWSIEGFRRLHARGRFEHTRASQEALAELMRHRDQAKSFVMDRDWVRIAAGPLDDARGLTGADLFRAYQEWSEAHGVKPFYEEERTFIREAAKKWPELAERKKRVRRFNAAAGGEERVVIYRGLELAPLPGDDDGATAAEGGGA